jgi:hypothetical protein
MAFFVLYLCPSEKPMRKAIYILLVLLLVTAVAAPVFAQCSICTRTAAQMGEKPARGLNAGILYLAFVPFAVVAFISYNWWKRNRDLPDEQPAA